ncbi:hypothetical protein MHH54_03245 [Bacillus sp. FSL K6-4563]|nr:hypothetical protein [Bacillus pumilus]
MKQHTWIEELKDMQIQFSNEINRNERAQCFAFLSSKRNSDKQKN